MKFLLCVLLTLLTTQVVAKSVTINSGKVSLSGVYFASNKSFAPAVLLLHGCHRLSHEQKPSSERTLKMASLLQEMGFGVLMLDVDGPNGPRKGCLGRPNKKNIGLRANDAQIAIAWLKARNEVDASKIAVIGWAEGASTVLSLMNRNNPGVKSAVAFYPNCQLFLGAKKFRVAAPTLLLIGEEGQRGAAQYCRKLGAKSGQDLFHQVSYPDADHDFATADLSLKKKSADQPVNLGLSQPNTVAAQDAWRRSFKWISRWFDPERSIQGIPPSTNLP